MSILSRLERLEKMVADSRKGLVTVEYKDGHTELKKLGDCIPLVMEDPVKVRRFISPEEIPVQAEREPVIKELITVCGRDWEMTCVSMGNPHAVVFISTPVKEFPLEEVGPFFENHSRFPKRTNTEFIRVLGPNRLEMRVWERGAGETYACGTGACAAVVAAVLTKACGRNVTVELLGGNLEIEWRESDGHVYMTGPAATVFDGEICLPEGLE